MNTVRLFVFAIAFLATAFLLRTIVDYLSPEQPIHAVAIQGDVPSGTQSAADPVSR